MPPVYQVSVLAPDHRVYEGKARSVVAPGSEGYFGVLADHAPMVAGLRAGELAVVEEAGEERFFAVSGGFLEVTRAGVTVLADAAEGVAEIDVARAEAARERARRRLAAYDTSIDMQRTEAALRRALNRLHVAKKHGRAR